MTMRDEIEWTGTVVRKSRGLLDGSSLYRRVTVRRGDGSETKVRVGRALWKRIRVGDRLVKEAGKKGELHV